jgi:hypothetical protein
LLRQECVPQIRRPLHIAGHPLDYVWKFYQSLNTWVPRLLCHCVRDCFTLQILVSIHPLLELDNFKRVGRSGECLSQQWVGI